MFRPVCRKLRDPKKLIAVDWVQSKRMKPVGNSWLEANLETRQSKKTLVVYPGNSNDLAWIAVDKYIFMKPYYILHERLYEVLLSAMFKLRGGLIDDASLAHFILPVTKTPKESRTYMWGFACLKKSAIFKTFTICVPAYLNYIIPITTIDTWCPSCSIDLAILRRKGYLPTGTIFEYSPLQVLGHKIHLLQDVRGDLIYKLV